MNIGARILAASIWASCALVQTGFGQAQLDVPPPQSPFVAPLPEFADWTVATSHPELARKPSSGSEETKPLVVQTVRTKDIRKQRTTLPGGETVEIWMIGTLYFTTDDKGRVAISDLADNVGFDPSSLKGFPGFSWLSISNYAGTRTVEKGTYYYFAQSGKEAWIDIKSKLPFALSDESGYTRYTFAAPPVEPLTLPAAMQQRYDRFVTIMQRVNKIAEDAKHQ